MNIEIFSDLVCPWCFIGKRRLDQALARESLACAELNVVWRAYQLYPGIPVEGMSRQKFNTLRYGDSPPSGMRGRLEAEAAAAGIALRFDRIATMPNTFRGHRLLAWSRQFGVQHALAESLFSAYFEQGLDLGDAEVLHAVALANGLDREAVAELLASDESADEVRADLDRASNIGVTGVPSFILAGRFALPGAQESEVIGQFIERASARIAAGAG
jgi:predicted DsbA family dithiol-disulfide isomerase